VGRAARGHSAGQVTSKQQLIYASIESSFGADGARDYAIANQDALDRMGRWVTELGIDCAWEARPAYVYAETDDELGKLRGEHDAALRAGLPAAMQEDLDLPYPVAGALRFDDQAQFHPQRYLAGLAAAYVAEGGRLYEHTRATAVEGGPRRSVVTPGGAVGADHVFVATHIPFLDSGLFFARTHPERSYVIGVRVDQRSLPEGMYINASSPTRSLRTHPQGGGRVLLVGGEGHKVGQDEDTRERYARLEQFAREHWPVRSVDWRWSTQDNVPVDGVPFVGRLRPDTDGLYVATGFRKWGLTNGTAAAVMIADRILGRSNPWAATFDSSRLKPLASAGDFVKENVNVARRFVQDHLRSDDVSALAPGEGGVVGRTAVSRTDDGELVAVSAVCTHLRCAVRWNTAERTWDCPCHGSRFDQRGRVLQGPATEDLAPREAPGEAAPR
jgi:glycine/D-amino acid oxidase-like deaminating enzyme/nitrite reductase/ring-hydroxylating ferredoxin subunit